MSHPDQTSFGALTAMTSSPSMEYKSTLLSMHILARSSGSTTAIATVRQSVLSPVFQCSQSQIRAQLTQPDELYQTGQQHGFILDNEVLLALESALLEYGRYNRRWEV
jgi:hypothetical protein